MSDATRTATCVAILAKDEAARLLTLSWHLVEPGVEERVAIRAWSRVSGVALRQVERLAPVLFAHAICKPDRSVDAEAERICAHLAAMYLRATGGKR